MVTQTSSVATQKSALVPITCPSCGDTFQVPLNYLGKRGRCKGCSTLFTLPSASEMLAQVVEQQSQNRVAPHLTPSEPILMATVVTQPMSVPPSVTQQDSANDDCWSGHVDRPARHNLSHQAESGLISILRSIWPTVIGVVVLVGLLGLVVSSSLGPSFDTKARRVVDQYMLQNYGVIEGYGVEIDSQPVDLPGHMGQVLMAEVTLSGKLIAQHHADDTITRIQFYFRSKRPYDFLHTARFGSYSGPLRLTPVYW